jgi:hypothetical protein
MALRVRAGVLDFIPRRGSRSVSLDEFMFETI